jgi:hypothetical protein
MNKLKVSTKRSADILQFASWQNAISARVGHYILLGEEDKARDLLAKTEDQITNLPTKLAAPTSSKADNDDKEEDDGTGEDKDGDGDDNDDDYDDNGSNNDNGDEDEDENIEADKSEADKLGKPKDDADYDSDSALFETEQYQV